MKGSIEDLIKALRPLGKFKRNKNQFRFNCPKCENELDMLPDKFNLEVSYSKNAFHCWACSQKGNLYNIVKKYGYKEYLDLFQKEKLDEIDYNREELRKEVELPRYIKSVFDNKEALDYLYKRGLTNKIIKERKVKFCYGGVYNGWLVFPTFNCEKELTAIVYHNFQTGDYRQKKNSSFVCFFEDIIDKFSKIVLVEGIFDALCLPNSIPLLGNKISEKLLEFLNNTEVLLILDSDLNEEIVVKRVKELKTVCSKVEKHVLNKLIKDINEFYLKDNNLLREELKTFYT